MVQLTNETGSLTKTYEYDAFGNEKNADENDTNPFRYCGEYYDRETGTIYLRARYYDARIGRFITEDSYLGEENEPLSLNLYTYCYNNPVLLIDESGNSPINSFISKIITYIMVKTAVKSTNDDSGGFPSFFKGYMNESGASEIIGDYKSSEVYENIDDTVYIIGQKTKDFADETCVVFDASITYKTNTYGYSKLYNLGQGWESEYVHVGAGFQYEKLPMPSLGIGLGFNIEKPYDYEGFFLNINANYNLGVDYCWWDDISAFTLTLNPKPSITGRLDYYFLTGDSFYED